MKSDPQKIQLADRSYTFNSKIELGRAPPPAEAYREEFSALRLLTPPTVQSPLLLDADECSILHQAD